MRVKEIPDYDGMYYIREDGCIFRSDGYEMKGNVNSYGYRVVSLTKDGKKKDHKVHRLLAIAFIPNPNNYECVNHIDGNKLNNSLYNLEWCSKGYNNRHARSELGIDFHAKPVIQSDGDGKIIAIWANANTAATILDCPSPMITACCNGTAQSSGGYKWSYAGKQVNDFLKESRIQVINSEIQRLQKEIENLKQL